MIHAARTLAATALLVAGLAAASASAKPADPLFAPGSIWNQPLSAHPRLDPSSGRLVGALVREVRSEQHAKRGPWINTRQYGVPILTVRANQPAVRVRLSAGAPPALQGAFAAVPLPSWATPSEGTDRYLVVWQPSNDRMWEFWQLRHDSSHHWLASWGGAMQNVSANIGVYGPRAWPGATTAWGVTASSFPLIAGVIRIDELRLGRIDHALALSLPTVRAGVFASPAERTDGGDPSASALPEGTRLRIDPRLNLNRLAMPPLTRVIAKAAQRYGIIIRDYAANVAFSAQDPEPWLTNPFAGAGGFYGGLYPNELLRDFPWSRLQVLRMHLHSGAVQFPGS